MKYIIELSDDEMEKVKNSNKALFIDVYGMMANIIKNGIPLEEHDNPNSIRINFVGEEAEEFKQYLENQQEKCRWNEQGMKEWEKLQKEKESLEESKNQQNNEFFNFDSEIIKRIDCISREEAIKKIRQYGVGSYDFDNYTPEQAERFVIQKLSELSPVGEDINTPTTDYCVSRKEVMQSKPEWLNENVERDTPEQTLIDREYSKGWNKCLQVFLVNIKQLPSVKPAAGWIPTSEELPKKDESVQLTICANSALYGFNKNFVKVLCGSYSPCEDKRDWIVNGIRYYIDNVIAWKPLSEPYELQESEVQE